MYYYYFFDYLKNIWFKKKSKQDVKAGLSALYKNKIYIWILPSPLGRKCKF